MSGRDERCIYCGGAKRVQIISPVSDGAWADCYCVVIPAKIADERDRCAVIADEHATSAWEIGKHEGQSDVCSSGRNHGARAVAAAIRSQP